MNLTTATPAEIDEAWAPLAAETFRVLRAIIDGKEAIRIAERDPRFNVGLNRFELERVERAAERAREVLPKLEAELVEARKAEAPYQAEWDRRNGWTRAYLVVTNGQGHVHRSTHCDTCYPTTQFAWLTELSGKNEQEIVDLAGERACTRCYASAPVALRLDRPTQLFSEDEKRKQAERAEREQKRAAADAEKIEVVDWREDSHTRRPGKTFKTARALTNAIASELSYLVWLGANERHEANVAAGRQALADRGIAYDFDKALTNARKRFERESGVAAKY